MKQINPFSSRQLRNAWFEGVVTSCCTAQTLCGKRWQQKEETTEQTDHTEKNLDRRLALLLFPCGRCVPWLILQQAPSRAPTRPLPRTGLSGALTLLGRSVVMS